MPLSRASDLPGVKSASQGGEQQAELEILRRGEAEARCQNERRRKTRRLSASWTRRSGLAGDPDKGRAKQPILEHIAGLHLLDDRAGLGLVMRELDHRLVLVRIERLAHRLDAADAVAREDAFELASGGLDAGEQALDSLVLPHVLRDR